MVLNNFYLPATRGCHARDYFEFIRRSTTLPPYYLTEIILIIFTTSKLASWAYSQDGFCCQGRKMHIVGQKVVLGAILIPFT